MDKYRYKEYGEELRFFYCPICDTYDEANPDFSVNKVTGKYMCHRSGKGGDIKNIKGWNFSLSNLKVYKKKENKINFSDFVKARAGHHLGNDWLYYLKGRGISDRYLGRLCRLGKNNTMMIPLTDGKEVVGIKYRSLDKKCCAESGSSTEYFLNWQNVKERDYLIIVEGEIDLLSALEVEYENVVSLPFGAKNLKCIDRQMEWIGEFSKIIIGVDNDEVGREAKSEIVEKLKMYKRRLYQVEMGKFKDFNEVLEQAGEKALVEIIKGATKIEEESSIFFAGEDGYYIWQGENCNRLTDFTLEITGYSDNYIIGKVKNGEREREFKNRKVDFLTKNGMLESLGYYFGSTQSIPKFWSWILESYKEAYLLEIEHYGIIDNLYYDTKSRVVCEREDLKILPLEEIGEITPEERRWLNKNLIHLRSDTNQSLLGICWALGRLHITGNYPILEVSGTTSIGKTEYVEFISRILFGGKENIKSFTTLTNHQIRSLSSCSNITPWVIDEVKIAGKNLKEKAIELYSTIRAVYDNKTLNQGNVTHKLTKFKLSTPLIISGETELSDVSIRNRMISTELTRKNKSSDSVFFTLKCGDLLEKFGKLALEKRLSEGAIDIPLDKVRKELRDVKEERQLYNGRCILTGLKAFTQVLKLDKKIKTEFVEFLNRKLANEYNVVTNFLELLELVVNSGQEIKFFYTVVGDRHFVRFNLLYKAIADEHFKTNSTLELLDMKTLRKQLLEEGVIINTRVSVRFLKNPFTSETLAVKADEIKPVDIM